jgi:hypothetical protein
VDLDTGSTTKLVAANAPPDARVSPAATYDAAGERFFVFGGTSAAGTGLTDLWSLDLGTSSWEPVLPPCAGAGCPVVTGRESLLRQVESGEFVVVADRAGPGASVLAWVFHEGMWQTRDDLALVDGPVDCDEDGLSDGLSGARCAVDEGGFPAFGRLRCDGGALACRTPLLPGAVVHEYSTPRLRTVISSGDEVYFLQGTEVDVHQVEADGTLAPQRRLRLRRAAHDIALLGDHLLAADGAGLSVYRASDGAFVSSVGTCGKVRRVFVAGSRAIMVGVRELTIVDLSMPPAPAVVVRWQLQPGADGRLAAGAASGCGWFDGAIDRLCDATGACGSFGRDVAAFDGSRLFLNMLGSVYVVDVRGATPVVSPGIASGRLRDMRLEGRLLYANTAWGEGLVLASGSDGAWTLAGTHDVQDWAAGTVEVGSHVLRWGPGRLVIATRQ